MSIVAWIVLGAVAGYLAGFLAGAIFDVDPLANALDGASIITAVIGAVLVVMVVSTLMGRSRTGRGAV